MAQIEGLDLVHQNHVTKSAAKCRYHENFRFEGPSPPPKCKLDCPAPTLPTTTTYKPDFYYWTWTGSEPLSPKGGSPTIAVGGTVKISEVCNPDFVDPDGDNCLVQQQGDFCTIGSEYAMWQEDLIFYGNYDPTEQTFQTGLNCPECGCTDTYIKPLTDFQGPSLGRSGKKDKRKLV